MLIRNRKIIGLIAILVGLAVFAYEGYYVSVMFYGKKANAEVSGFVFYRNGVQKVQNDNSSSKPFSSRSPFLKFQTGNGETVDVYSRTLQLFNFSGYHLGEKVSVAYNPQNPEQIFIMNIKEIPGLLLMIGFGLLLIFMGRSFIFQKAKSK